MIDERIKQLEAEDFPCHRSALLPGPLLEQYESACRSKVFPVSEFSTRSVTIPGNQAYGPPRCTGSKAWNSMP